MSICPLVTVSVTSTGPEGRSPALPKVHRPLWERLAPPPAHSWGCPSPTPNPKLPPAGPRPEPTEARESCVAVASVGAAEGSLFFPNLFLAGRDSLQCPGLGKAGNRLPERWVGLGQLREPGLLGLAGTQGLSRRVSPGQVRPSGVSMMSTPEPH